HLSFKGVAAGRKCTWAYNLPHIPVLQHGPASEHPSFLPDQSDKISRDLDVQTEEGKTYLHIHFISQSALDLKKITKIRGRPPRIPKRS
ncbi:hypothetical protein PSW56_23180, partial [Shigella flexneri]|nr:hypothetical protein [Shigella flexneri]